MKKFLYDIALTLVKGLGHSGIRKIIDNFESAEVLFSTPEELLVQAGMSVKVVAALKDGIALERAQAMVDVCENKGVKVLVRGLSSEYPELLAECSDAPHVLYQYGDINLNHYKLVSIVGTRRVSQQGIENTQRIVKELSEAYDNIAVVSGLAFGVDKQAHCEAIKHNIPTVAILPGWVLDVTPRSNIEVARQLVRSGGAILSDIPVGTTVAKTNFLSRNRLIAGISSATIVVEAPEKSGSTSTANMAHAYNRSVFALPGRSDDLNMYGTNQLIKSTRAILYQDVSDLAVELGWARRNLQQVKQSEIDTLPSSQRVVYSCMPQSEPITLEEICIQSGYGIGECSSALLHLECGGVIKSIPGGMYVRMRF